MGGNTKFKNARYRTAIYEGKDGTRKAVTDSNGNIIRVGVGPQVGRDKRTNTAISNARERMLNAKAIQDIRDTAKQYQKLSGKNVLFHDDEERILSSLSQEL